MALPKPQLNGDVLDYDTLQTNEINSKTIVRGDFSEGHWTQFPDGTMIINYYNLQNTIQTAYNLTRTIDFPKNFVDDKYVLNAMLLNTTTANAQRGNFQYYGKAYNSCWLQWHDQGGRYQAGDKCQYDVTIIGRWK